MPISPGLPTAQVTGLIQQKLIAVREALRDVNELYKWTSGLAATDLSAVSTYSATDAPGVLAAVKDANELAQLYSNALTAAIDGYPVGYILGTSIAQVIGPL